MQDCMVTRTLTTETVTVAAMLVRISHAQNKSMQRALSNAETRLLELPWRVDGGVLAITSHSTPGHVHYTDGDKCDCLASARHICWHRAAFLLLATIAATGVAAVAPLPLPANWPSFEADELPGDFLDLDFDDDGFELTAPVIAQFPPRGQRIVTHEPIPGSDYARACAAVDELFAAA